MIFDNAARSAADRDTTTRFSLHIMNYQHGATVKEVEALKR